MKYSLGGRERLHTDGFRSNDELELATPKDSVYERTVDGIQPGFSLFQVTQHSSAVVLFLLPSFFFSLHRFRSTSQTFSSTSFHRQPSRRVGYFERASRAGDLKREQKKNPIIFPFLFFFNELFSFCFGIVLRSRDAVKLQEPQRFLLSSGQTYF